MNLTNYAWVCHKMLLYIVAKKSSGYKVNVEMNYEILEYVSQKFCNILVTWGTIQHLRMLFLRLWRWWIILDCEMPSLPGWINLYDLEHSLSIHGVRSIWPSLIVKVLVTQAKISWIIWLLYCNQLCLHFLHNKCFWLFMWCYGPV